MTPSAKKKMLLLAEIKYPCRQSIELKDGNTLTCGARGYPLCDHCNDRLELMDGFTAGYAARDEEQSEINRKAIVHLETIEQWGEAHKLRELSLICGLIKISQLQTNMPDAAREIARQTLKECGIELTDKPKDNP